MNELDVPVLFVVFNRPDTTKRVFEAIRQARPKRLYVAADGARADRPGEREKCEEVRGIVKQVDWDCEIFTLFRERNLGCKHAVSSAINWFFQNEERGIILEDDCLPDPTFFPFCRMMLEHYKDEEKVWMIAGVDFTFGQAKVRTSYYFSRYYPIWGWATWRRAWEHYDIDMVAWPAFMASKKLHTLIFNPRMAQMTERVLDKVYKNEIDTWDYQWSFSAYVNEGFCLCPSKNLVSNIGVTGTHISSRNVFMEMPVYHLDMDNIVHSSSIQSNKRAEGVIFDLIAKQYTYHPILVPFLRPMNRALNRINPDRWKLRSY